MSVSIETLPSSLIHVPCRLSWRTVYVVSALTALEATTDQIDNLVLPLAMYTLLVCA